MRLDHIAYRVRNRKATAQFFIESLNYKYQTEFPIDFGDGTFAQCIALEPPEKESSLLSFLHPNTHLYHLPPEIFISDGNPGSIVHDWVQARGGIGGIHHVAYQVDSVQETMNLWKQKGYAEFSSEEPLKCPGVTQVFTKPSSLTGIIFEFIERGKHGFCQDNVKALMQSTRDFR